MQLNNHISDHDLERYYLGMVREEAELAPLEEHLLACPACVARAEETQDYVDAIRAALTATERV
jgi:anti-sigma factor RsiW